MAEKKKKAEPAEAAAEWAPVDSLTGWPSNPRKRLPTQAAAVARSVVEYGWGAPIVARRVESGVAEIIAGHGRHLAITELRRMWSRASEDKRARWHPDAVRVATRGEVPVRFMALDERGAHQLAIADNRAAEDSKWDRGELQNVIGEWHDAELDIDALGFNDEQLRKILGTSTAVELERVDVSDLFSARFSITVRGPLRQQLAAIRELHERLRAIPDLEVVVDVET